MLQYCMEQAQLSLHHVSEHGSLHILAALGRVQLDA